MLIRSYYISVKKTNIASILILIRPELGVAAKNIQIALDIVKMRKKIVR